MKITTNPSLFVQIIFLAAFTFSSLPLDAQNIDFQNMSEQERTAFFAKRRAAAEKDWQRMMDLLNLQQPASLPPAAEDPNRPQHLFQREGSNNWYDEAGNTHVRSGWGNWSNYDESQAGGYTLPDPLVPQDFRAAAIEIYKISGV